MTRPRPTAPALIALCLLALAAACAALPATADAKRKRAVTPAGWSVTPVGREISIAPSARGFQGPLGTAISPDGRRALSVSSGLSRWNSADLFDLRRRRRTGWVHYDGRRGAGEAVFYGVTFSPGGRRAWASGGGQNVIHVYRAGRRLREVGQIQAPYFPAGLAYGRTLRGHRIYVANNLSGPAGLTNPPGRHVTVIDPRTNRVISQIDLGVAEQPLDIAFERRNRKAYVTHWMGRSVSVIDTAAETLRSRILLADDPLVADHPSAIAANPRRDEVYTANGNSDTVSVIDTRRDRVATTIDVSLVPGAREGAMPSGLAVSRNGRRLYVALAGENAVAVIDLVARRTIGFLPAAWSPTDVDVLPGRRILVTSANAAGMRPNRCAGPYAKGDCADGDLAYQASAKARTAAAMRPRTKGALTIVTVPRTRRALNRMTARVRRNNRALARQRPKPAWLGAIKHVIYVVKENRTYDQVLGDLGKGRGDPSLTLFKDDVAPNHHVLARRFTLFDNFFADADVSADGMSWVAAAGVNDYVSKMWPITYSSSPRRAQRARDFEHVSVAERFLNEPMPFDASVFRGAPALTRGYIWDSAYEAGVSYRSYGMYTVLPGDCRGTGNVSTVTRLDERFGDHVDERYPGFNMRCSDHAQRLPEWEREFRAYERALLRGQDLLPQLTLIRLPNDHTWGTVEGEGTPEAYMADNDLALGRLVDVVSHSPFWRDTAIFVTEDDAQNGPDHVDAHRTMAYIISPYTQTARVDSTHYSTASMVATIEDVLGLPPLTTSDQRATRMWRGFSSTPNFAPYDAIRPKEIPYGALGAARNGENAPLGRAAARWDFDMEDATPEIALNEAIWKSVKGRRSEMPAPRHSRIIGSQPVDLPE